jgi:hypothetical protein
MGKLIDERFHKYGRLTVLNQVDAKGKGDTHAKWFCRCDCGNFTIVSGGKLRSGNTKSCGCLRKELAQKEIEGISYQKEKQLLMLS